MTFRGRIATTGLRPEDRRNRVLSALGTHLVALGDTAAVVRSDFLLFAAEQSPEASLLFPSNAQVLELRVNGQAKTVKQQGAYCVIDADEKINHVAIQWVGRIQQGHDGMRLPVVANIVSENIAVLTQSENISGSAWKPLNPQLTVPEFEAARAASIRRSLRLVDPTSPPSADLSLETGSAFWDQLSSSSPQAAKSFRESLNAVRNAMAGSSAIVNADDRSLALSKPLKPTPLQYAGVIFGGLLLAVSLLKPVRSRKTENETESAVTEIGESAIVEPSTHSAASNSQLPDDGADPNGSTVAGEDV